MALGVGQRLPELLLRSPFKRILTRGCDWAFVTDIEADSLVYTVAAEFVAFNVWMSCQAKQPREYENRNLTGPIMSVEAFPLFESLAACRTPIDALILHRFITILLVVTSTLGFARSVVRADELQVCHTLMQLGKQLLRSRLIVGQSLLTEGNWPTNLEGRSVRIPFADRAEALLADTALN